MIVVTCLFLTFFACSFSWGTLLEALEGGGKFSAEFCVVSLFISLNGSSIIANEFAGVCTCIDENAAGAGAAFSSMQVQTPANSLAIIEEPFKEMKSETTQNSAENLPPPSSASSNVPQENEQAKKVRNKHVTTIMNIFRPKGYTSLNDTDIINAWE